MPKRLHGPTQRRPNRPAHTRALRELRTPNIWPRRPRMHRCPTRQLLTRLMCRKKSGWRFRVGFAGAAGAALGLALAVAFLFYGKAANNNHSATAAISPPPQKSIAV